MKFGHFTAGDVASLLHCIRNWAGLRASLDMAAKKKKKKNRVSAGNRTPVGDAVDTLQWLALKGVCL
jgi:hypothetical protein